MGKEIKNQAIALKYDAEKDPAPKVVAKGEAEIAEKIIEIAKLNNIPIEQNKDLAALLNKVDLDQFIPVEAYIVVAEIIAILSQKQGETK